MIKSSKLQSSLHIKFGSAFDLFGNKVDINGNSFDSHNRPVDPATYLMSGGEISHSEQRDEEYTKELGDRIIEEFFKINVILSTHITAFCIFVFLQKRYPKMDLYRLIRLTPDEATVNKSDIYPLIEKIKNEILSLESQGKISIDPLLVSESSQAIMTEALRNFSTYYAEKLLIEKDDKIIINDLKVIYYYHNKVKGYDLEKILE